MSRPISEIEADLADAKASRDASALAWDAAWAKFKAAEAEAFQRAAALRAELEQAQEAQR